MTTSMHPSLCLSKAEVAQLTRTPVRARQLAFLRMNGIRHYIDQYGCPVILRSTLEKPHQEPDIPPTWKPNKAA